MKIRIPRALLVVALTATPLAILHALGVRRSTSVLAGIATDPIDAMLALVYIGCWFFTVLVGPIVMLSLALLRLDGASPHRPKNLARSALGRVFLNHFSFMRRDLG